MKKRPWGMVLVFCLAACACMAAMEAEEGENAFESDGSGPWQIVKVIGRAGHVKLDLMSPDAVQALEREVANENKYLSQAMQKATADWKASEDVGKKSFPKSAINKRKVTTVGKPYDDFEKAQRKLNRQQEGIDDKIKREKDRQRERRKRRGLSKDRAEKEREKQREEDAIHDMAREYFDKALAEVMKQGVEPDKGPTLGR